MKEPTPRPRIHFGCVRVGTQNGPKLDAVRGALSAFSMDPEPQVLGHAVESGVPDQPVGLAEIVAGARNRAHAAHAQGPCDLAVGIEDGLVVLTEIGSEVMNIGAAVLTDGERESVGLSSGFAYPSACVPPALEDREPRWRLRSLLEGVRGRGFRDFQRTFGGQYRPIESRRPDSERVRSPCRDLCTDTVSSSRDVPYYSCVRFR